MNRHLNNRDRAKDYNFICLFLILGVVVFLLLGCSSTRTSPTTSTASAPPPTTTTSTTSTTTSTTLPPAPTSLSPGDFGPAVEQLQQDLTAQQYWLGEPDGKYGLLTTQAVIAFQKQNGLEKTGKADATTLEKIKDPTPFSIQEGEPSRVEISLEKQLLYVIKEDKVLWAFNTSTGDNGYYYANGKREKAYTPTGDFKVERQINGQRNAPLGELWRPKYFLRGWAFHGSPSVPAYPASHGCARLTDPAINMIWDADLAPLGTQVKVY